MPISRRLFLAGLGATFCARPALAAQSFNYGPAMLDLYPVAQPGAPVAVYVHGGGWRIGSRRRVENKPAFFNAMGWHFVSIDYRMLPEAPVETQAADVASAVQWVRDHARDFGGDGRRIALLGHSAGAHLVALTAMTGQAGRLAGLICDDVNMYDVPMTAKLWGGRLYGLFADAFGDDPQRWAALSPANHVGKAPLMPVLVAWSDGDQRRLTSRAFAARLEKAGARVQTFDGVGYSHRQINVGIGADGDTGITGAVRAFVATL